MDNNKRRPRSTKIQLKVRRKRCLELAIQGYSSRQISEILAKEGVSVSHASVSIDINKGLAAYAEHCPDREEFRTMVRMRYERILNRNWTAAIDDMDDLATKRVMNALKELRQLTGIDLPPDPLPPSTNNVNVKVTWDDEVKTTSNDPYDEYD